MHVPKTVRFLNWHPLATKHIQTGIVRHPLLLLQIPCNTHTTVLLERHPQINPIFPNVAHSSNLAPPRTHSYTYAHSGALIINPQSASSHAPPSSPCPPSKTSSFHEFATCEALQGCSLSYCTTIFRFQIAECLQLIPSLCQQHPSTTCWKCNPAPRLRSCRATWSRATTL
jgi:hypothetical protein